MSIDSPKVGEVSPDGQFRWDGGQWEPLARGYREPTQWTRPLQQVTAAYLVVATLVSLVTTALFTSVAQVERSVRSATPQLPDDQVHMQATLGYAVGWVVIGIVGLIFVGLAIGGLLGWRWVFWVDVAVLALSSIGVVTNLLSLAGALPQSQPAASYVLSLVLSLAAVALLVWFLVAAVRYGPWAMRRPGA
jgi:hypothetical protein